MVVKWLRRLSIIPAVALLATVAGGPASPAAAWSPGASFTLTIYQGGDTSGPIQSQVTLTCDPNGGTHPNPDAACSALESVGGSLAKLTPVMGKACPMFSQPVTARAIGTWLRRPEDFQQTYMNRCFAAVDTGYVFDF